MTAEERIESLSDAIREYKEAANNEIKELKAIVARLQRKNEELSPFSCRNLNCKDRKSVKICPNCGHIISEV